jgi:transposase
MLIIGNDFHPRYQRIAMLNTETGEFERRQLEHTNGEVRTFYANLPEPALVGIEATSYTLWFAESMSELGHELAVGDAAKIRASETRKQKYDDRAAYKAPWTHRKFRTEVPRRGFTLHLHWSVGYP